MTQFVNPLLFTDERKAELRTAFEEAKPYRHLVIDGFLKDEIARELDTHFPADEVFSRHYKGLNERKSEGSKFDFYHERFSQLREQLSSQAFCQWVSEVTGIAEVFITDDGLGAGLHKGSNGSFLDIHIDFNIHPHKNVHRRLNLLIYLSGDWQPEWNGAMEMWNADMSRLEKAVMCEFNRCIIFETSEISYHGYSKKLECPEGKSRRSFYAYFYTNEREGAAPYHDTVFKARPDDATGKKVITTLKERLKNTVKATLKKLGKPI
jgi:Rps23 Pro-64 3,4-dihydroxylase Tpa1-like proline 4-hydroxylase